MTIPDNQPPHENATPAEHTTIHLDDGDIHLRQDGPRSAPALLLVHGLAGSVRWWDPLMALLAATHRMIRVDLPGHGRSSDPTNRDYAITAHGRRLGTIIDLLEIESAFVIGHSTGGSVAASLAEQRPELVTALTLINTGPCADAFVTSDFVVEPAQWTALTEEQIRHAMSPAFGHDDFAIPQSFVDDVRAMTYEAFAGTTRAADVYLEQQSIPHRLRYLDKPVQVIFGEDDRRWRSSSAADYRVVPGATIDMLPGVGHSPMVEDPQHTAALLLGFIASIPL